jgi:hypothetical protein
MSNKGWVRSQAKYRVAEYLLSLTDLRTFRASLVGLAILFTLISSKSALAQFGASLNGTVQDSTGAVIPGATIKLTNEGNQQARTATSSSGGSYTFTELAPGRYSLTVTAANFKSTSLTGIQVSGEAPRTTNITLDPGGNETTVQVDASDQVALQTSDASIGSTLTSEAIQRLPAVGGDVYELLRTAPGITGDASRSGSGTANFLPNGAGPGQSNSGIFQTENQIQISAAGQQVGANNFLIDGVSVNSLGQAGAAVVTPNQESVSQLTVLSTSYSAEDGRNSGAQIKAVTKSGTNTLHGSAYFRYDEPGLNAYSKAFSVPGTPQFAPVLRVNNQARDFAGSIGGPIIKDKLFLFASYEGFKVSNNSSTNQYIETPQFDAAVAAQRGGTVTGMIIGSAGVTPRVISVLAPSCSLYSANGLPCAIVAGGLDVGSFGGATRNGTYFNQANCVNPTDPACVAGFAPGTGGFQTGAGLDGVPDLENAQILNPTHSHANQFNGRVDYYFSPKDQFAASFYITKLDQLGPSGAAGNRPQSDIPQKPKNSTATVIYIHTFTPTLLNEARANFTRFFDNQLDDAASANVNFGIPEINIQNLPTSPDVQYGVLQAPTSPGIFAENTYEVRDAVTKSMGSRTLKIGGEYRWEQDNNNLGGGSRPVYAFQGLFNFANNAPIYEGIFANPLTGGPANTARYLRSNTLGVFAQHDWKITPSLTINTGVRYEYFSPIHNKGQELNLPVLGPAGSELSGATLTPHNNFYDSDYTGVTPKFGFAYVLPLDSGKMVVRGGVARAMNRLNFSIFDNAVEDGPGFFNYGLCCGTAQGDFNSPYDGGMIQYSLGTSNSPTSFPINPALKTTVVNNLPVGTQIEVYGAPSRVKTPYAYLYSLETQVQLKDNLVLTIGFQGSEAHHLPRLVNQNFLYSTTGSPFTAAYFAQTDSNSNYAGLNTHISKTMKHGFLLDATYTYSKSLDQISNGSGADSLANQTNPAFNSTEWGPSDYDDRHRITASGLWSIPGTHSDKKAVNILTNGWQINGIYTFHTGFPFTPVVTNVNSNPYVENAATISPVRPYGYGGGYVSSCSNSNYVTGNDVKNAIFVAAPPAGTTYKPGIGRNSFSGPCYTDTDLSLAREQSVSVLDHKINVRFQANLFNAFNQLNLIPFTNGNAGGPAQIVGDNPDTGGSTTRTDSQFGRPTGADAGRIIEFFGRVTF